ncbi:LAME_0H18558g1_1 [Lachancea meyersii CBS 8951]|uniref:ribonuclease H n=1 Tax=Lachancea meyersii CBS 8951 TaxID=1266667 RepID=A0A1G4KIW4_9SACH|nr:LAME_0H18558g1_1 [Lachancea meyersii CBS 8951]
MARGGFYAVQNGRSNGVFNTWEDCKSQVSGYSGAVYKKFDTLPEAVAFSNRGSNRSDSGVDNSSNLRGNGSQETAEVIRSPPRDENPIPRDYGLGAHHRRNAPNHLSRNTESRSSGGSRGKSSRGGISKGHNSRPIARGLTFYAVKSSNPQVKDAIFENWSECRSYVTAIGGLSFKKFGSRSEALDFINGVSSKDYDYIGVGKDEFARLYARKAHSKGKLQRCNVYCDGSALGNGKESSRAGYGVYFENHPDQNISEPLTEGLPTNNRAEIQAVFSALDKIWTDLSQNESRVLFQIKTDSEYVSKLLNDRYMGYDTQKIQTLSNSDLIKPLIKKYAKVKKYYEVNKESFGDVPFKIEWVKGHAGEAGNEIADELARQGASRA